MTWQQDKRFGFGSGFMRPPAITGSGPPDEPEQEQYTPPDLPSALARVTAALQTPEEPEEPRYYGSVGARGRCVVCGKRPGSCDGPFVSDSEFNDMMFSGRFRPY
jgi:hypothetical protein